MKCALCDALMSLDNRCPNGCAMGRGRRRWPLFDFLGFAAGWALVAGTVVLMWACAIAFGAAS